MNVAFHNTGARERLLNQSRIYTDFFLILYVSTEVLILISGSQIQAKLEVGSPTNAIGI